jgi:diguanylate cyclase (GGDEF)-like protein
MTPPVLVWNASARLIFYCVVARLLAQLRLTLERAEALARTDPLTGLLNRRAFYECVEYARLTSLRSQRTFTLAYLDMDNFKQVNDTLGHRQGEALLVEVSGMLRAGVRATDRVARLGGDEFGVLFPETDGLAAHAVAEQLHAAIGAALQPKWQPAGITIGVVAFAVTPGSIDEAIAQADTLMYDAKRQGKARVSYSSAPAPFTLIAAKV